MEIVKTNAKELIEEKSGFIKINKSKLADIEKMIVLLNNRKQLAKEDYDKLSPFEKNERDILLLRTDADLSKFHKKVIDFKAEMEKYVTNATSIIEEMEEKWNEVLAKAKRDAVKNKNLDAIVKSMDDVNMEENLDVKMNYYLQLKSMVYNTGKPTLKKT